MFFAKNEIGEKICARCGSLDAPLTKDHYIPKVSKMNVDEEGNLVGLCKKCNREKGNQIVRPDWYTFLKSEQKNRLWRYVRYTRSYILQHTEDMEFVNMVKSL